MSTPADRDEKVGLPHRRSDSPRRRPAVFERVLWIGLWLAAAAAAAQPADATLEKIVVRVRENQARLPNYLCGQTILRESRGEPCKTCRWMDRLRVDVAVIGNHELFAWPGEGAFEEPDLFQMAGARGMTLAGDYAALAQKIFVTGGAVYERETDRPRGLCYSYRVEDARAGIRVRIQRETAALKHRGVFCVDPETLDLVRLEVEVFDIPPEMDLASAHAVIEYRRLRIGDAEFVLPAATEVETVRRSGVRRRNHATYAACRQYTAQSTLRFDEPGEGGGRAAPLGTARPPAGLMVRTALTAAVDLDRCAAGDELVFLALEPARLGSYLVPQGALLGGRITEFVKTLAPQETLSLRCRVSSVDTGGRLTPFPARLRAVRQPRAANLLGLRKPGADVRLELRPPEEGESDATLFFASPPSKLPKRTEFTWSVVSE